jgi:dTDP-4-dehydrorhamnose reductase
VDAIRHLPDQVIGLPSLVEQAWQRYRLPVAITECHLGSTREEQARWFIEVWNQAQALRDRGVDLRSVTAWSLLGAHDWNRMVTRFIGHYEPGVFDVRSGLPRPTLMAHVLKELAEGRTPNAPGLQVPGWWREERRKMVGKRAFKVPTGPRSAKVPQPLMIIGDGAVISRLTVDACEARGLHYILSERDDRQAIHAANPWAVFDARKGVLPETANALALVCAAQGITGAVLLPSGDAAKVTEPGLLTVETGPVFTLEDEDAPIARLLDAIDAGETVEVRRDVICDAVYGPSLVDGVLDLLLDQMSGAVCLIPAERWSEAELVAVLAVVAGHRADLLVEVGVAANATTSAVTSYLPPMETMLERFVRERRATQALGLAKLAEGEWELISAAE